MRQQLFYALALFLIFGAVCFAQSTRFVPNDDEAKVPKYTLPDPLVTASGMKVTDAKTWAEQRRP